MSRRSRMSKIREIIRLQAIEKLTLRQIARSVHCSHNTVKLILQRAQEAHIVWPIPEDVSDDQLEEQLYPSSKSTVSPRPEPDMDYIEKSMQDKHTNLTLLWVEYKMDHPDGVQYTQFCERYRKHMKKKNITMHQQHKPGEKMLVDWAGDPMIVRNRDTGECRPAWIFVSAVGVSGYPYAEAFPSKHSENWITANVHALTYYQKAPLLFVPDNDKSAVTKAHPYEPILQKTYQELARHYGCVIVPARVRKPKDKAVVESTVRDIETWIIGALRHQTFFSFAELNQAISEKCAEYAHKPFQKKGGSRYQNYMEIDFPAMRPLPPHPFEYAQWKWVTVGADYHVEVDHCYYSVPYTHAHDKVEIRTTSSVVEIFHKGLRIASHPKTSQPIGAYHTQLLHMPDSHRCYATLDQDQFMQWAETIGPNTQELVRKLFKRNPAKQQHIRSCMGLQKICQFYGQTRFENACQMALEAGSYGASYVERILQSHLDEKRWVPSPTKIIQHANIRGKDYYQCEEGNHVIQTNS